MAEVEPNNSHQNKEISNNKKVLENETINNNNNNNINNSEIASQKFSFQTVLTITAKANTPPQKTTKLIRW